MTFKQETGEKIVLLGGVESMNEAATVLYLGKQFATQTDGDSYAEL